MTGNGSRIVTDGPWPTAATGPPSRPACRLVPGATSSPDRERWRGSGASPRAGGRRSAVSGRARAAVDGAPIPAPRPAHRSVTGRLPDRERCPGRPPRPRGPLLRVDDLEHERAPRRVDLQTGFLAGFRLAHADRLSPSRGRPPGSTQSSRPPPVRCRSRTAPARTTTTEHRRSTSDSSLSWPGAGPPACIVIPDPHRREPPDGHRPGAPGPDHRRKMIFRGAGDGKDDGRATVDTRPGESAGGIGSGMVHPAVIVSAGAISGVAVRT